MNRLEYKKRTGFILGVYFLLFLTIISILSILVEVEYRTSLNFSGISIDETFITIVGLMTFVGISIALISQFHLGYIEKTRKSLTIVKGSMGKKYIIPHKSILAKSHNKIYVRHMSSENQVIIYLKNGKWIKSDLLLSIDKDVESVLDFFEYKDVSGISELRNNNEIDSDLSFDDLGVQCTSILWIRLIRFIYITTILVLIVSAFAI